MLARCIAVVAALAALSPSVASAAVHTVAPGETLSGIALANGLPTTSLATANGLSPEAWVLAGTTLTIPAPGSTAATSTPAASAPAPNGSYLVQAGDSLSVVAARHGVSQALLASVNGLSPTGWLLKGTTLRIPAPGAGTAAGAPEVMGAYKVRPGDSLSALAARSGVPMAQMAYMNGLDPDEPLLIGTVLKLPTGASVSPATTAPASTVVPAVPPSPTQERLSGAQIASIAAQHGVPSSLAAAIAWQESGFNNALVSAANARGIMQILPGTWDWVQSNLTTQRLNPASAHDNVRAGALYLAQLLRETDGDPALAAAGYYQGLASVRRVGMFPETRQYVANVLALRSRFGG